MQGISRSVHTVATTRKSSFYSKNDLFKFDNKNVIYIAYVGVINKEQIYKYGKSCKLYEREYNAHRKNFDTFDMKLVKITDNKDIVEDILGKELQIRNMKRSLVINSKRQTELFAVNEDYDFKYVCNILNRIILKNPSYEVKMLKEKIAKLSSQLKKSNYKETEDSDNGSPDDR